MPRSVDSTACTYQSGSTILRGLQPTQPISVLLVYPAQDDPILYMADVRLLPGMEGGSVCDAAGEFIGALWLPVYSGHAGAEVPLIVPAHVLAAALTAPAAGGLSGAGASSTGPPAATGDAPPSAAPTGGGFTGRRLQRAVAEGSAAAGRQLVSDAAAAEGPPSSVVSHGSPVPPHRRRLAALAAALQPVLAAGPPDLAPAVELARRGVVGVVAAGGRWASGVVVIPCASPPHKPSVPKRQLDELSHDHRAVLLTLFCVFCAARASLLVILKQCQADSRCTSRRHGIVLTNAHLLPVEQPREGRPPAPVPLRVRVESRQPGGAPTWHRASVVRVFAGAAPTRSSSLETCTMKQKTVMKALV